jgi:hypothetical protein
MTTKMDNQLRKIKIRDRRRIPHPPIRRCKINIPASYFEFDLEEEEIEPVRYETGYIVDIGSSSKVPDTYNLLAFIKQEELNQSLYNGWFLTEKIYARYPVFSHEDQLHILKRYIELYNELLMITTIPYFAFLSVVAKEKRVPKFLIEWNRGPPNYNKFIDCGLITPNKITVPYKDKIYNIDYNLFHKLVAFFGEFKNAIKMYSCINSVTHLDNWGSLIPELYEVIKADEQPRRTNLERKKFKTFEEKSMNYSPPRFTIIDFIELRDPYTILFETDEFRETEKAIMSVYNLFCLNGSPNFTITRGMHYDSLLYGGSADDRENPDRIQAAHDLDKLEGLIYEVKYNALEDLKDYLKHTALGEDEYEERYGEEPVVAYTAYFGEATDLDAEAFSLFGDDEPFVDQGEENPEVEQVADEFVDELDSTIERETETVYSLYDPWDPGGST